MGAHADIAGRGLRVVENAVRRSTVALIDLELVEVPAPGPVRELQMNTLLVWWGLDDAPLDPRRISRGVRTSCK